MELEAYSPSLFKCHVCDFSPAQFHFGAVSCRSCAAFFRRTLVSRKLQLKCSCTRKPCSSRACRLCRMNKCLEVGMKKSLVQPSREKYASGRRSDTEPNIEINHLVLRAFERIQSVKFHYDVVNNDRELMQNTSVEPGEINYYQLTCGARDDFPLLTSMVLKAFPELNQLSAAERNTLFTNFYPKWYVFESALMEIKYDCSSPFCGETSTGKKLFEIRDFYQDENGKPINFSSEQLSMFIPYWEFLLHDFKKLIADIELTDIEEMFLLGLLLFDSGYSNLSPKSIEMSDGMRKCILRELKSYCLDKVGNELRLFEILNVLPLIEKAEQKSFEELQLCCLHNIHVDEEYYKIMSTSKY